ncbi:hypothetical protein V5N11_020177 [Cardamine amara subsp. amara]|uniref:Retrotransposon gag domain-containing protein n=1 Tax=Cardamine amara subsp. amara TaxID=228776 RepID=A0ABD0ZF79_CARAN
MRNAFHAKNKLNFIDGILQRPSPGTDLYKLWGIINSMMVAWILNTIDPELRSSVSCSNTAYDLWMSLKEHFSVGNDPLTYQLQSSIRGCKQEGLSVQAYFGKLKRMWDDLEDYDPIPPCCCGNTRCAQQNTHIARRDKERKSQFLMGLDGARFGATRSNILSMSPSPSLSAAYSIQQEEKHQSISQASDIRPDACWILGTDFLAEYFVCFTGPSFFHLHSLW